MVGPPPFDMCLYPTSTIVVVNYKCPPANDVATMLKGQRPGIGRPTLTGRGGYLYPQGVSSFGISPDSWINLRIMRGGAFAVPLPSMIQGHTGQRLRIGAEAVCIAMPRGTPRADQA